MLKTLSAIVDRNESQDNPTNQRLRQTASRLQALLHMSMAKNWVVSPKMKQQQMLQTLVGQLHQPVEVSHLGR